MDTQVMTALANEARRGEMKTQEAKLKGKADAIASLMSRISSMNSDTQTSLAAVQAELAALNAGAGPGITDDFGVKSSVTQLIETEREMAKAAVIDFVKLNPNCTEQEAETVWIEAAVDSHPGIPCLQDAIAMSYLYRVNLVRMQLIPDMTWPAWTAWLVATPRETILEL